VIYIFSTLLTAGQRLKEMNRIFISGLVIDLTLNFLLIPPYKAIGAAMAALSTQTFVAAGMVWLCMRIYGLKPGWRGVGRLVLFSGGLLTISQGIMMTSTVAWPVKFAAILCAGAIMALFSGMLDWKAALKTIKAR
jgi:O-antigen/teichoic acid export membrane protein